QRVAKRVCRGHQESSAEAAIELHLKAVVIVADPGVAVVYVGILVELQKQRLSVRSGIEQERCVEVISYWSADSVVRDVCSLDGEVLGKLPLQRHIPGHNIAFAIVLRDGVEDRGKEPRATGADDAVIRDYRRRGRRETGCHREK